jgi:hypothetical protein
MDYQMNLQKIGVMIRRGRLLKLNASHLGDYGPKGFIICSTEHPFFDVQPGYPVCTRPTLLRLEQGKDIQEEELYRFFLHKLGLSYAFSMRREKRYDQFCFDFAQCVTEASLADIAKLMLPEACGSNLLYDFYDRLLRALHGFYTFDRDDGRDNGPMAMHSGRITPDHADFRHDGDVRPSFL